MANLNVVTVATAGAAIGLAGGWATARRGGRPSSERLLDAAEEYVIVLRSAMQCVLYPHDGEPRLAECRRLECDLWVLVSRIQLLYAPESNVAAHAAEATGALAAVEVLVRRDPYKDDMVLRERIDAEERRVEREYRAFLQATRAVIRANGRSPAGSGIRARVRAVRFSALGPERRRGQRPEAEQPPPDEFLRDLDELLRLAEKRQPTTDNDAARKDRDT